MKKTLGTLMVAVSALAFNANAQAFEYTPYVGLDYIHSTANTEEIDHYRPDYDGVSVNVGTNYNRFFGTEAFYQTTDKDNKRVAGLGKFESSYQAYGLDLMGYLPLFGCEGAGEVSLIGTAGVGMYNFKSHWDNEHGTGHDEGVGYRLGTGLQYKVTDSFAVRGIARYIGMDKVDDSINADHMMEYSAGVKYSF